MKIIKVDSKNQAEVVLQIVQSLGRGELVIFPTETTYGAGVDATNQAAVDKLLAYKARREGKPLSIAVTDIKMAAEYVELNEAAKKFYQTFLPGPFTIVSKSKGMTARGVESEFGTLGVRIPDYPLVLSFVEKLSRPVTATSANSSGKKSPYKISDILDNLSTKQKELVDLIVDAGELPKNKPSTVIDTTLSVPITLRQGDGLVADSHDIKNQTELVSNSSQETMDLAKRLLLKNWSVIKKSGLVVGLDGELGVGKTVFAKGVAEFLQIKEPIVSPTYNYVNEYDFKRHMTHGKFFHFDVWKIETKSELEKLDFFKNLGPNAVVVVEWWQQIEPFAGNLPSKLLKIKISETKSGARAISLKEK